MKTTILVALLSLMVGGSFGQSDSTSSVNSEEIHTFLKNFHEAAIAKDSVKLTEYVDHWKFEEHDSYDLVIPRILADTTAGHGDFSYTNDAMQILVDSLYDDFVNPDDSLYGKLIKQFSFSIGGIGKDHIYVMDKSNCSKSVGLLIRPLDDGLECRIDIVLVKKDDKIQLVFWDRMTSLVE